MVCILITTYLFDSILSSGELPHPMPALNPLFVMIGPLVIKILSVFDVPGGGQHLVHILISTHPFGPIIGSDKSPHPMLALDFLFMTIRLLVIEILSVFVVLGEDNILVHILITTHLFNTILGSEEGPMSYTCSQLHVCDELSTSC